jgi:hypothetical protein
LPLAAQAERERQQKALDEAEERYRAQSEEAQRRLEDIQRRLDSSIQGYR